MPYFDPDFDDCTWTDQWGALPLIQVTPGTYPSFVVKAWEITEADICGQALQLSDPLPVRGLITHDGTLWMSDVPQERLMMYNNAVRARGDVLVGGLGLGLYAQYALPRCTSMTVLERDTAIIDLVEPVVRISAAAFDKPLAVRQADVSGYLQDKPGTLYDTIFLDTWATLDAVLLPGINTLREAARAHLKPGGEVLLWGYGWMLRLYLSACETLLEVPAAARETWLASAAAGRPDVWAMLLPVLAHFAGQESPPRDAALAWCRAKALAWLG